MHCVARKRRRRELATINLRIPLRVVTCICTYANIQVHTLYTYILVTYNSRGKQSSLFGFPISHNVIAILRICTSHVGSAKFFDIHNPHRWLRIIVITCRIQTCVRGCRLMTSQIYKIGPGQISEPSKGQIPKKPTKGGKKFPLRSKKIRQYESYA
jgi:hypothetical protein